MLAVLIKGGERFSRNIEVGKSGHSRILMPTIDELLKEADITTDELDVVAAVVGPGSFTGIRIGVACVSALAFATGAKRISVTSFELIAYNSERITAAVDAGHGNLYVADCENGRVIDAKFVENSKEADRASLRFKIDGDPAEALASVVKAKAENGEFIDVIVPYYMRKSQAEREKDEA